MINWTNTKPKHNGEYLVKLRGGATCSASYVNGRWVKYEFHITGHTELVTVTPLNVLCWSTFEPEPGEAVTRRRTRRAGSYFNCVAHC